MDRREESPEQLSPSVRPGKNVGGKLSGEVVPCPQCGLLAPVLPPPPTGTFPESRCARGHFIVLVPAVHEYLKSQLGPAFS